MGPLIYALSVVIFLLGAQGARAGDSVQSAPNLWQALTRVDVEAAYSLLMENHPGAVPEVGDTVFTSALAAAHDKALRRAAEVTSYEGYTATLGEFAYSLGDGHIGSAPRFTPRTIRWAGLIAEKRGTGWIVANDEPSITGRRLVGAHIISCDGQSVEERALEALHFQTVVSVEAMQIIRGYWLLVDNGNPFLAQPNTCVLEQDGQRISVQLNWAEIKPDVLLSKYWTRPYGQAGYGVRKVDAGYWIALQSLTPPAQPVIDAVKAQKDSIRSAPFVVVDVRGNGGGDDSYARMLAEELFGPDYVASVLGRADNENNGSREVFRASADNIAAVTAEAQRFQRDGDTVGAKNYTDAISAMKSAAAAGHALTGNPASLGAKQPAVSPSATSLLRAKVFILTDSVCFSSSLQAVGFFRKLGAVQVGQTTGADTRYSEARVITLPSGLSLFSTLQAIMPDAPRDIGPYVPDCEFKGDIADTAALEKWIANLVTKAKIEMHP